MRLPDARAVILSRAVALAPHLKKETELAHTGLSFRAKRGIWAGKGLSFLKQPEGTKNLKCGNAESPYLQRGAARDAARPEGNGCPHSL